MVAQWRNQTNPGVGSIVRVGIRKRERSWGGKRVEDLSFTTLSPVEMPHKNTPCALGRLWGPRIIDNSIGCGPVPALSCPFLPFPALPWPPLASPALPCPLMPCPALTCPWILDIYRKCRNSQLSIETARAREVSSQGKAKGPVIYYREGDYTMEEGKMF